MCTLRLRWTSSRISWHFTCVPTLNVLMRYPIGRNLMSASTPTYWANVASRLSQLICGLSGHQLLLNAEPGRLSLKCMSCPYETPGWAIKEKAHDVRSHRQPAPVFLEQRVQS
jgi:hypothetical protein